MDPGTTSIVCATIAALATIISAISTSYAAKINRKNKEEHERAEKRYLRRAQETELSMDLMYSSCALSLVAGKKVLAMLPVGVHDSEVEDAIKLAEKATEEYTEFVRKQAAASVAKY